MYVITATHWLDRVTAVRVYHDGRFVFPTLPMEHYAMSAALASDTAQTLRDEGVICWVSHVRDLD